jgi:hypothetical protein
VSMYSYRAVNSPHFIGAQLAAAVTVRRCLDMRLDAAVSCVCDECQRCVIRHKSCSKFHQ